MPWISRKELQDIRDNICRLERKVEALERGAAVNVHRDVFHWSMAPFRLPVAEAIEQVVRHLGMHFEHKPGTPEQAVLSLGRTTLGCAVTGITVSNAPKT